MLAVFLTIVVIAVLWVVATMRVGPGDWEWRYEPERMQSGCALQTAFWSIALVALIVVGVVAR